MLHCRMVFVKKAETETAAGHHPDRGKVRHVDEPILDPNVRWCEVARPTERCRYRTPM